MAQEGSSGAAGQAWKVMIVDDDEDVHLSTRMALRGMAFRGRPVEFVDAYSGREALTLLQAHPDTALIFLDIIMETREAGLTAIRAIRESGFHSVRIIVRTGFPGEAPEQRIVVDYDIHDYKEKTGLSVQKLFTSTVSALRAYADLVALERHKRSLLSVLDSVSWFDFDAVRRYASGMLAAFADVMGIDSARLAILYRTQQDETAPPRVFAFAGDWGGRDDLLELADFPAPIAQRLLADFDQGRSRSADGLSTLAFGSHGQLLMLMAEGEAVFEAVDEVLLEIFLRKLCQAIGNQRAFAEVLEDRDLLLRAMALRAEGGGPAAAAELDAVSALATALARRLQATLMFAGELDASFVRNIGVAAALHDLGDESLPPGVLDSGEPLSAAQRQQVQRHVAAGLQMLEALQGGRASTGVLCLAREVIAGHHEHFDGSGYPAGLRGEAIPLAARLAAVADACVALTAPRPHRPAMALASACAWIAAERGRRFDPQVVDAFVELCQAGALAEVFRPGA